MHADKIQNFSGAEGLRSSKTGLKKKKKKKKTDMLNYVVSTDYLRFIFRWKNLKHSKTIMKVICMGDKCMRFNREFTLSNPSSLRFWIKKKPATALWTQCFIALCCVFQRQ